MARCLKVSFKITSVASYVYILSPQKFTKNAKMSIWRVFEKLEACGQIVFPEGQFW